MKLKFTTIIILFYTTISLSQNEGKIVAVFYPIVNGISDSTNIKKIVRAEMSKIVKISGYTVVEKEEGLKILNKIHKEQRSGDYEDSHIVKLGKKINADNVCYVIITPMPQRSNYQITCIFSEILTGKMISIEIDYTKNGLLDIVPVVKRTTNTMLKKINPIPEKANWPVGIWLVKDKEVKYYLFENGKGKFFDEKTKSTNYNITWILNGNDLQIEKVCKTPQEVQSSHTYPSIINLQSRELHSTKKLELLNQDTTKFIFTFKSFGQDTLYGNIFVHSLNYSYNKETGEITKWGDIENVKKTRTFIYLSTSNKQDSTFDTFTDTRDNITYKTIKIGNQVWMAENLKHTTTDSWCYKDINSMCDKYGCLYKWLDAWNACPKGWHLPSYEEWEFLIDYLNGHKEAGGKLKSIDGWLKPNSGATNESGFSALPSGQCYLYKKKYHSCSDLGKVGYWWTLDSQITYYLSANSPEISKYSEDRSSYGSSLRCIKD